jgi:hypothetical protein
MCVCCGCEGVVVDRKKIGDRIACRRQTTEQWRCVGRRGERIEEGAGLRREMDYRAGRIESWCDPVDGSIQVVVGMGEKKEQVCNCGKGEARRRRVFACDSELARPKQHQRQPKVSPAHRCRLRQGVQPRPLELWVLFSAFTGGCQLALSTDMGVFQVPVTRDTCF